MLPPSRASRSIVKLRAVVPENAFTAGIFHTVPLTAIRGGTPLHLKIRSMDRADVLKRPQAN